MDDLKEEHYSNLSVTRSTHIFYNLKLCVNLRVHLIFLFFSYTDTGDLKEEHDSNPSVTCEYIHFLPFEIKPKSTSPFDFFLKK